MAEPLQIYTDGSSNFNGKPNCVGGWAMCIPNFMGKMYVRYGHLPPKSSNNKGEIMGVLWAMHCFHKGYPGEINITSDSQYVVKSVNEWRKKWKMTAYQGISNRSMFVPLFNMIDLHGKTNLIWVKGHRDNKGNILADEFAGLGMREIIREKVDSKTDIRYVTYDKIPYDCHD